jgi:hypothetical protein
MKLDKIMIKEAKNDADIVLYRHGLFLRAYERSTYHLSTLCQFKVIYKYIEAFVQRSLVVLNVLGIRWAI